VPRGASSRSSGGARPAAASPPQAAPTYHTSSGTRSGTRAAATHSRRAP
jgi:hypothetical protein